MPKNKFFSHRPACYPPAPDTLASPPLNLTTCRHAWAKASDTSQNTYRLPRVSDPVAMRARRLLARQVPRASGGSEYGITLRRSVAEYCHELLHAVNVGRHGDLLRTFHLWNVSSAGAGAEEVTVKRLAVFTDQR